MTVKISLILYSTLGCDMATTFPSNKNLSTCHIQDDFLLLPNKSHRTICLGTKRVRIYLSERTARIAWERGDGWWLILCTFHGLWHSLSYAFAPSLHFCLCEMSTLGLKQILPVFLVSHIVCVCFLPNKNNNMRVSRVN